MSASSDAISRRLVADPRIAVLGAISLLAAFVAAALTTAAVPAGVVRISASDAQRTGAAIQIARRGVGDATLVELHAVEPGASLLAVSGDGRAAALADRVGELQGTLTLANDDGSQLRIPFPGLLMAAFAPDASWLAVIDGRGAVWKVDAASGDRHLVLDGPFLGAPAIEDDGSMLLLSVPSVEAPYLSQLVQLDSETGITRSLSDAELVYGAFPLDGGDLAIVVHENGGTVVHRLAEGDERLLMDLGPGAVNVVVAGDGRVAFERADVGVFVVDAPSATPRDIGSGSRPCFGPDGRALLVLRGTQRIALGLDGSVMAVADELSAFAGSEGCPS